MKALALIALLSSFSAFAKCAAISWNVWPSIETTLPLNARIVIGGYGTAKPTIEKLASYGPALVAKGHRVELQVTQTNVGEMKIAQAVLVPVETLKPSLHYRLTWKKLPPDFSQPANWTTGTTRDEAAPQWLSIPSPQPGVHEELGCGPAEQALVDLAVHDASPFLIRARVLRGSQSTEYLLPWTKGEALAVGHGMCSGAFQLKGDWKLELAAVDVAGNEAPMGCAAIQYKNLDAVK